MRKTKLLLTVLFIIALALPMTIPLTNSAVPTHHKATHAYIGATPNPLGVGQQTLIHVGITDELELVQYGWKGLTVTVTDPDNKTSTLGPFNTDSTGGTGTVFIPDKVGTYYFQTHFPAQWFNWSARTDGGANIFYEASDSELLAVNVTETQPEKFYPSVPLPNEYWTRPVNDQFRDWNTIASNFLQPSRTGGAGYIPYNDNAPDTAHILWAKPQTTGGLVGGEYGTEGYENGDAYEGLWGYGSPVIMGGIVYYSDDKDAGNNKTIHTTIAVDLKSGQELWEKQLIDPATGNSLVLTCGQILKWNSYNYQGAKSYLWANSGTTWNAFDPFTARWEYSIINVPSGTQIRGPDGEFLIYTYDSKNGWMTMWNSTHVVSDAGSFLSTGGGSLQSTFNASSSQPRNGGYQWNVTAPKGLPGSVSAVYCDEMLIGNDLQGRTATANILGLTGSPWHFWAVNVKSEQAGTLIYNKSWTPPSGNYSFTFEKSSFVDNVFTVWSKELRGRIGFNMQTGEQIWGPTEPEYYLQTFGLQSVIAYGNLYSTGYGGHLWAYDLKTGNRIFDLPITEPYGGTEVLWSANWPMSIQFITDGKVYISNEEHSANQPLPRDGPFLAVNATDGSVIFRIDGAFRGPRWAGHAGIADGAIVLFNTYDNQIYSIGKGPSKTSVTIQNDVIEQGNSLLIKGRVTDISAGTTASGISLRFPNGVPAVSDNSMSEYMKYVYQQFPAPTNTTGVPVTISVLDANGNYRVVGTAETDANGDFNYLWTPDISGVYKVYATFTGTNSYWSSTAETAVGVTEQSATPTPMATPASSAADLYFLPAIAGLFVAIIVSIALSVLVLMRKP